VVVVVVAGAQRATGTGAVVSGADVVVGATVVLVVVVVVVDGATVVVVVVDGADVVVVVVGCGVEAMRRPPNSPIGAAKATTKLTLVSDARERRERDMIEQCAGANACDRPRPSRPSAPERLGEAIGAAAAGVDRECATSRRNLRVG
jgi:hypothetical protein